MGVSESEVLQMKATTTDLSIATLGRDKRPGSLMTNCLTGLHQFEHVGLRLRYTQHVAHICLVPLDSCCDPSLLVLVLAFTSDLQSEHSNHLVQLLWFYFK